ncbi:DUF5343 domain-containing protein [Muricoccus radiodurans]|uniref:DUF5343 domain-containing protein n=1 Tax=Muricoccus radiodurans TaxID=2231721 RepID=UPI003CF0748B
MMGETNGAAGEAPAKAPPYISYKTFRTFVQDLHEHTIPRRIDRSVLGRFSGTVGSQLLSALRFLRLIDNADAPTDVLRDLVGAHGTDGWPDALARVVQEAYAPVVAIGLDHATPSQMNEAFRTYPGSSDEVRRKCILFFTAAANEAGIAISKRILDGLKRGAGTPVQRRPKQTASRPSNGSTMTPLPAAAPSPPPPPPPPADQGNDGSRGKAPKTEAERYRAAYEALSDVWEPENMEADVDAAVVIVLRHLRKRATEPKA